MPKKNFDAINALSIALLLTLIPLAHAADKPEVPDQYQEYFRHYVDRRSIAEKILNSINLTINDVGRSFALIAGASNYPNLPRHQNRLDPAAEDLKRLESYLREMEFFDEIVILKNGDLTLDNLAFFLENYFPDRLAKFPKSRFLFAYSGHGSNENDVGYLLKPTALSLNDKQNRISVNTIKSMIDGITTRAQHVLVLMNSCYSGLFLRRPFGTPPQMIQKHPGAHAITAGGTRELAWHDPAVGPGSIFFEKLFAGLDGRADLYPSGGGDGVITTYELFNYLRQEVQLSTDQNQNPQIGDISLNGSQGEFFFLNRLSQVQRGLAKEWSLPTLVSFGETHKIYFEASNAYEKGEHERALLLFQQAAEEGDGEAMNMLGGMYWFGEGKPKDTKEAFHWFKKGAESGNGGAMTSFGIFHMLGLETPQNGLEAKKWFIKAVDAGEATAMYQIGFLYEYGLGIEENKSEAFRWYKMAAENGDSASMDRVGVFYSLGQSTKKDIHEATKWLFKAAELGETDSMWELGLLYAKGNDIPKDPSEAVRWFKRAAEKGNDYGMFYLGFMLEKGRGVPKDLENAIVWYRKAAEMGNSEANDALKRLTIH